MGVISPEIFGIGTYAFFLIPVLVTSCCIFHADLVPCLVTILCGATFSCRNLCVWATVKNIYFLCLELSSGIHCKPIKATLISP